MNEYQLFLLGLTAGNINDIYEIRAWLPPSKLDIDPIALGAG
jgi:hypothetical protein